MADGVDAAEDLLRHRVGQPARVAKRVQDVQRQPAYAEDGADPERGRESAKFSWAQFRIPLATSFLYSRHKRHNTCHVDFTMQVCSLSPF